MQTYNQIRQAAEEMGIDLEWALKRRRSYLSSEIPLHTEEVKSLTGLIEKINPLSRELANSWIEGHKKAIEKLERELMLLEPRSSTDAEEITGEMIQRARAYPITDLLQNPVVRNMTNCINHTDKTPSMSISNNRVKCFSCGFRGDSIDVYQKLHNVNFKLAVKNLN